MFETKTTAARSMVKAEMRRVVKRRTEARQKFATEVAAMLTQAEERILQMITDQQSSPLPDRSWPQTEPQKH